MKIKKSSINLYLILIIVVAFFPKINIINIPGSSTGIRIDDILIAITSFLMILKLHGKQFNDMNIKKTLFIFSIYIAICIISIIIGTANKYISPMLGLLHLVRKIEYFIFIFFGYKYFKFEKNNPRLMKVLSFSIIFHFSICILQYFGLVGSFSSGEAMSSLTQGRVSSTFNGAYELSAFLLLLLPIYLYNIFNKKGKMNILYIIIIFLCIFISESRISLLAFFVILFLMFYHYKMRNSKKGLAMVVIAVLLMLLGFFALRLGNTKISERLNEISISGFVESTACAWEYKDFDIYLSKKLWYGNYKCMLVGTDPSWNLRVNHWMQLIDGTLRSPLFGTGVSIAGSASDGEYIRVLAESGIIGLILWLYLYYIVMHILNKYKDDKNCIVSKYALIGMLIGAIFIDIFSASKVIMMFWFFVGMSYSSIYEVKNEKCSNN